jgi:hypothetical protein
MSQSRRQFVAQTLGAGMAMQEQQNNLKAATTPNNINIATTLKIVQVGDAVLRSQARQLSVGEVRSKEFSS